MDSTRIYHFATLMLAVAMCSCSAKKEAHQHVDHRAPGEEQEWKQMDDFHMIMAETFHPYKDSANLEPAKARALELLKSANEWMAAPLPEQVDTDEVRSSLRELRSDAQKLAESVKSADDNEIAGHLTKLHDTFHVLQEHWYGGNQDTSTPAHDH